MLVRSIISLIWLIWLTRFFLRSAHKPTVLNETRHLVLLLKVLREEATIESTLKYIHEQIFDIGNIICIVVGTAHERNDVGVNGTLLVAKQFVERFKGRLKVIEAPATGGTQAAQKNYGLLHLDTSAEKTWILTLDIDSRISRSAIFEVIENINRDVPVMQMGCLFLSNWARLSIFQRGHAIHQSRWTLAHELRRLFVHNKISSSIAHVVGHGFCIRRDILAKYGDFPKSLPIEDVHLGFYLVAHRQIIKVLSSLEVGDSPDNLLAGLRQEYVWSHGAADSIRYVLETRKRFPSIWKADRFRIAMLGIHGTIAYFFWLTKSWIIIAIIVLGLCGLSSAWLTLGCYAMEYWVCAYLYMQRSFISLADFAVSPLYGLIGASRNSLPADIAFVRQMLRIPITKFKTPHS